MVQPDEDLTSGDLPLTPSTYGDDSRPQLAHEVIATYVADAVRSVPGVADLHTSPWKSFSSRGREVHSGGIVVRDNEPDPVDVGIHVRVLWGTVIPDLAAEVDKVVRERVKALLSIELGTVTLYVDEIAEPTEVVATPEG